MDMILSSLYDDHRYMLKMTYLLDKEVKALTGLVNVPVEKDKIFKIINYIKAYSSNTHHCLEDFLFSRLMQKDISESDHVKTQWIMDEHDLLADLVNELESQLKQYINGGNNLAVLLRIADNAKDTQLSHIQKEQDFLFPLLTNFLSELDWHEASLYAQAISQEFNSKKIWELLSLRQTMTASLSLKTF